MLCCCLLVVDGRCWACQVEDLVNLQQDGLNNIMPDQLKVGLAQQVHDVVLGPSEEVIQADDLHMST